MTVKELEVRKFLLETYKNDKKLFEDIVKIHDDKSLEDEIKRINEALKKAEEMELLKKGL
nr:hypothetical protein [uncultured Fusobacterium sp.]